MSTRIRRGAAAAECAVCLPLLLTIVLGAVEACNAIFLKQALQTTAYEAARVAASPPHDFRAAREVAREVLDQRRIKGGHVHVVSSQGQTAAGAELVVATAAAPLSPNRLFPAWLIRTKTLSATCTMMKRTGY